MRDPYEILGVPRSASFEEVKAAYRRACKTRHPDMGGSHEEMVELNTAYAFILDELKSGYQKQREEAPNQDRAEARGQRSWEHDYRDIDEELEEMRRAAEAHEDALRAMRANAWKAGDRAAWAKLSWEDLARFFSGVARGGVKGLALLFAALVGVGSILVEANFISALILLGSGLGFASSLALKSDKGGFMSAGLLLFGLMTLWLPPVREALFQHPVATTSVLILLALIFKFAHAGGTVGLMTGGVLALYCIAVIVDSTAPHPQQVAMRPPIATAPSAPPFPNAHGETAIVSPPPTPSAQTLPSPPPQMTSAAPSPVPPEPRTLLASQGALLKFVAGIPYRLKVRTGFTTSIRAIQGKVAFDSGSGNGGECVESFEVPVQSGAGPWQEIGRILRACGEDAVVTVIAVR